MTINEKIALILTTSMLFLFPFILNILLLFQYEITINADNNINFILKRKIKMKKSKEPILMLIILILLRVNSYIGPHLSVGLDYITVIVGGTGDVEIKKFEHIKSYELPPNYQNIIKKGYKNPIP